MFHNPPSRSEQALLFARNFVKHPTMLGSMIPSSRFLVDTLLAKVDWDKAEVIVEYGPGVGTITEAILRRMRPDGVLIVIEMNEDFVDYLQRYFYDPRLRIVKGSAADVDVVLRDLSLDGADYIISGIPYTVMPPEMRDVILRKSREALRPDGAFLIYQFTRSVLPYLRQVFGGVRQDFEPLNILPARLFYCTR